MATLKFIKEEAVSSITRAPGEKIITEPFSMKCDVDGCSRKAQRIAQIPLGAGHYYTPHLCNYHTQEILKVWDVEFIRLKIKQEQGS